jgi:hypothetical protein
MQVTSPGLAAYLVILFEAVGDLAKLLNKRRLRPRPGMINQPACLSA